MSLPAQELLPELQRRPAVPVARPRTSIPPQKSTGARRGSHTAFWFFSAGVVSVLIFAVVALNALLVQTTYRMQSVQQEVRDRDDDLATLSDEVARLSSPERIAVWAKDNQMVMPGSGAVVVLSVPGIGSTHQNAGAGSGR